MPGTAASLSVVQTRFFYERMRTPHKHWYTLVRIEQGTVNVPYQRLPIERYRAQTVAAFNHLMCATCNRDSVSLIFCENDVQYVCALPQSGVAPVLQVLDVGTAEQQRPLLLQRQTQVFDDASKLQRSDLSCTVFSLVFDYIRTTNDNLFLVDVTAVPCAAQFVPRELDSAVLREWIRTWKCNKVTLARASACMVVRDHDEQITVRKLMQPDAVKVLRPLRT